MATVTKSIGTSSRDYSTIAAWEADLDSSSIYSSGDDAVGELYNDSVFVEDIDVDGGGSIGLDSITLTSSSAEGNRHNGNKGTGATVRRNSASRHLVQFDGNATVDTMTFSWIEFDGDDDTVSNGNDKQMFKCTGATELYIQNNLIHSFGLRESIGGDLFTKTLHWYDVLNAKGIRKRIRYLRAVMRDGH